LEQSEAVERLERLKRLAVLPSTLNRRKPCAALEQLEPLKRLERSFFDNTLNVAKRLTSVNGPQKFGERRLASLARRY